MVLLKWKNYMTVVDGVNEDQRILFTILLPVQRVILNRMMVRDGFKLRIFLSHITC